MVWAQSTSGLAGVVFLLGSQFGLPAVRQARVTLENGTGWRHGHGMRPRDKAKGEQTHTHARSSSSRCPGSAVLTHTFPSHIILLLPSILFRLLLCASVVGQRFEFLRSYCNSSLTNHRCERCDTLVRPSSHFRVRFATTTAAMNLGSFGKLSIVYAVLALLLIIELGLTAYGTSSS